ncbi:MAG: glycosyl hydrolase family 18 protein [Bacillota bacterium]
MELQQNQEVVRPNPFPYIIAILIVIILIGTIGIWYYYPSTVWTQDEAIPRMLVNDSPIDSQTYIWEDSSLLISLDYVKEVFDPHIYWEAETQRVIVTTEDKVVEMNTDQLTAYINSQPVDIQVPVTVKDDKPYIPIEFLAPLYNIELKKFASGIAAIDSLDKPTLTGLINKNTYLRESPLTRSPRIIPLQPEEKVIIYGETNGWYKVRNSEGYLGYVDKNHASLQEILVHMPERSSKKTAWKPTGEKINLTWDYMTRPLYDMSSYKPITGLNVISPTWFHLANGEGKITNHGSLPYVQWAHSQGLQVWALFSNSFDPDITSKMLRSSDNRKKVINQLLVLAELYNLDGINIDFENINYDDKDYFTQFLRELTPLLREQGLTVSVDVTVISLSPNWSMVYDRAAMGKIVDYIAVMTYDEHWRASPVAGSVASLPWVERGIVRILEQVPAHKLLLGVPFYTRIWEETPQPDGSIQVSSRAFSMSRAEEDLKKNNASIELDDNTGQYFGTYELDGKTYKIWIEDEHSMRQRIALVNKYDLAGVASWRKGFEKPHIWEVIQEELTKKP